jgi:hypothetical protein
VLLHARRKARADQMISSARHPTLAGPVGLKHSPAGTCSRQAASGNPPDTPDCPVAGKDPCRVWRALSGTAPDKGLRRRR